MNRAIVALNLVMFACVLTGCGWLVEEASEKAVEIAASADGEEVDVEFDSESGSMTVKTKDGDASFNVENDSGRFEMTGKDGTVSIATGKDAALPDEFPKDIPLYPGFKPSMVSSMPNGGYSVAGSVPAAIPSVKAHYDQAAQRNGWTETASISQQHVVSLNYEKDERILQVTATPDVNGTMISITSATK